MKNKTRHVSPPSTAHAPKGWLRVACLYLIILQPLLMVVIPTVRYDEFRLPARESTYMLINSIDAWWLVFVAAFGIWCGVAIWRKRPEAIKWVKGYLFACLSSAALLVAVPVLVPFQSFLRKSIHLEQCGLFAQALALFAIGYAYFHRAPRVRSLFKAAFTSLEQRRRMTRLFMPGLAAFSIVLGISCSVAAYYRVPLNIFQAAWEGDLKELQRFVAAGVDVNTPAANHDTPLHLAATGNMAEYLAGTPSTLEHAFLLKPEDIKDVRVLIGKLRFQTDPVSRMIWQRLSPAARDILQNPPMLWDGDLTVVIVDELNRILRENISEEVRSFAGVRLSPSTLALAAGDPTGVRRLDLNRHLLEEAFPESIAKYQIDARNLLNETPLHIAAFNGRVDVANVLVGRGAYLNARNNYRYTPLDYALLARKKGRDGNVDRVIALLVNHGAVANVSQR